MQKQHKDILRKSSVTALCLTMTLGFVPPVSAVDRVAGSIRVSGPAFAASGTADWAPITSTRPLVAGDRLKTGKDGYLVADMGANGLVGLFGDSEAVTSDGAAGLIIDVLSGKVAFHLEPKSNVTIRIRDSNVTAGAETADGYVEYGPGGAPAVVMEGGTLDVHLPDGGSKTVASGQRLELGTQPAATAAVGDERRATAVPSPEKQTQPRPKYAGLTARSWTAIAVVTAAVAGGVAAIAAGGGGGGGGGNGSPSGE